MSEKEAEAALCKQRYKLAMESKTPLDRGVLCWWGACGVQALSGAFLRREMLGAEIQARKRIFENCL